MKAGQLRHPVTIKGPPPAGVGNPNTFGQRDRTEWPVLATTWAEIKPTSGKEVAIGPQQTAIVTHNIRIRAIPGLRILPAMRVFFGDRVFNVISALDLSERGRELVILATEATPKA